MLGTKPENGSGLLGSHAREFEKLGGVREIDSHFVRHGSLLERNAPTLGRGRQGYGLGRRPRRPLVTVCVTVGMSGLWTFPLGTFPLGVTVGLIGVLPSVGMVGLAAVASMPGVAVVLAPPVSAPMAGVETLFTVCVASLIDALLTSWFNAATLAAGVSFGKKMKSDARLLAASGVMACGAGTGPAPVTMTRSSAPTLTAGPTGPPVAGSSLVTSTRPRRIVIVERPGETSAMTKVPRTATTTLGVLISRVSPGFIRALLTATAVRPVARKTVDVLGTSVIVRTDISRAVTVALPPSRTRTADFSAVVMRSRRKTSSLNLSGAGRAPRVTVAIPSSIATTPTCGSADRAVCGNARVADTSKATLKTRRARGSRVTIGSKSRGEE